MTPVTMPVLEEVVVLVAREVAVPVATTVMVLIGFEVLTRVPVVQVGLTEVSVGSPSIVGG